MSNVHALIDGDIVLYKCAFSCESRGEVVEPLDIGIARCDELMDRILHSTGAESYEAFLTGPNNFRYEYYPAYKANRTAPKPHYYEEIKQHLLEKWEATLVEGEEADDMLSKRQMSTEGTVICSTDKDLLQIPGHHYNFSRDEYSFVTPDEGLKFFYKQLLIGDTVDNIFGVKGYGPKKSARCIDPCETELEMFERVQSLYDSDERLLMNGICLWLRRYADQIWAFPEGAELFDESFNETEE